MISECLVSLLICVLKCILSAHSLQGLPTEKSQLRSGGPLLTGLSLSLSGIMVWCPTVPSPEVLHYLFMASLYSVHHFVNNPFLKLF